MKLSNKILKILVITPFFPNNYNKANGIFNLSRANALKNLGHDVRIISPVCITPAKRLILRFNELIKFLKENISLPSKEVYYGFKVIHPKWIRLLNCFYWKYQSNFLNLFAGKIIKEEINAFLPDFIICTWLNPFGVFSFYIKCYFKCPIFVISEGDDSLIEPDKYKGWKNIEKKLNIYSDLIICVSNEMKNFIENRRNLKNIKVLKNGYDDHIFHIDKKVKKNVKKTTDLISVGYLDYVKGHDVLIKAMELLDGSFKLKIIGEGKLLEKYRKYVKKKNLDNRIRFLGIIDHKLLVNFLQKSDIFCMPSRSEGLPAAPLEAMGCGVPVIASDVGGLKEIIVDGKTGFHFKSESYEDLADKIRKASNYEWDQNEIAKYARENFSWNTWAKGIIELYLNIKNYS